MTPVMSSSSAPQALELASALSFWMSTREALIRALAVVVSQGDFKVPPYPAIALRLQRMLADERSSLNDLAKVVAADPALAATVLAAANAAVGASAPITKLDRAVARLGARTVGAIAMASGVSAAAVSAGMLLDIKFRVWRRTMTCALVCQKLAPARGLLPEDAFLSGLLHGFGRSIAVAAMERLLRAETSPLTMGSEDWLHIAEEQRAPFARAVARAWQLPPPLADAIDDKERGASALNDLVIDADAIAQELELGAAPTAPQAAEGRLLDELVQTLPAALLAFSSPGALGRLVTCASSAILKPDHALQGELRREKLTVVDRAAKSPTTLTCIAIAPLGIEVESSRRYQECAVVRLAVGTGQEELQAWFTVVLCVPEGTRHRVELQLFSPPHSTRERWQALYDGAHADPKTSAQQLVAGISYPASARAARVDGKG